MNHSSSRFWIFWGPPISIALLVTALYVKKPDARDFIDGKLPRVKETIGRYAPPFEVKIVEVAPIPPPPAEIVAPAVGTPTPIPPVTPEPKPVAKQEPRLPTPVPDSFDLEKVCADATRWPKTVRLKAVVEFPAVVEGRVIGKLRSPAGAEARVVKISGGKLGVEYHGGGAWLEFDRTDFIERARLAWH